MPERTLFGSGGRDQAEGLRRLLGRGAARVLALEAAAPGAGASSAAANLAAALAQRGLQVLLVDGGSGTAAAGALLGLRPRRDLRDVVRGGCGIDDALTRGTAGLMLLGAHALGAGGLSAREHERLDAQMGALAPRFDYVLLDVGAAAEAFAPADTVVVAPPEAGVLTAAYACIKRAHARDPRRGLRVLFNRVADEARARSLFANLERVADTHLRAPLEWLASVPHDARLAQAALRGRSVIDLHPAAPAAAAFRGLAGRVAGPPAPAPRPAGAPSAPFFPTDAIVPAGA